MPCSRRAADRESWRDRRPHDPRLPRAGHRDASRSTRTPTRARSHVRLPIAPCASARRRRRELSRRSRASSQAAAETRRRRGASRATGFCPRTPRSRRRARTPADLRRAAGRRDRADGIEDRRAAADAGAGVPVVPGRDAGRSVGRVAARAAVEQVGYPALVKPSAGGGGNGMRIVRDAAEALDGDRRRRGAKRRRRSATGRCTSSGWSSGRATSRSRCSPTTTATSCTCSSASARCSAGTRR